MEGKSPLVESVFVPKDSDIECVIEDGSKVVVPVVVAEEVSFESKDIQLAESELNVVNVKPQKDLEKKVLEFL